MIFGIGITQTMFSYSDHIFIKIFVSGYVATNLNVVEIQLHLSGFGAPSGRRHQHCF
jgi:hypothetical protein